jgi:GDP-mannose 6-dehydrogenase
MRSISVFGLGYVGAVTAACLASRGHKIIGVDPNLFKVERIASGRSPIVEKGLEEMIDKAKRAGLISATHNAASAIDASDLSFISVGTPSERTGKLDLSYVRSVCAEIGKCLKKKKTFHWIVLRSTVLPGTTDSLVIPTIETESGGKNGRDFQVIFNPEFVREGTAIADFFNPPFTIIGSDDPTLAAPVREVYDFLSAPLYETPLRAAEMVKYSCNTFHALKVAFANEVGTICNAFGVPPKLVADIFKSDKSLNVSPAYLTPGFAFGGSCLPKDVRALAYRARELDLKLPLLEAVLPSNTEHIERAAETVLSLGKRKVGVIGLSFKSGTDDLRESPMVHLIKKLIAEGCDVRIWDENVSLGQLIGSNRHFIDSYIPHIGTLLRDNVNNVIAHAEVLVVGSNVLPRDQIVSSLRNDQFLVDVANLALPVLKSKDTALATSVPVRS